MARRLTPAQRQLRDAEKALRAAKGNKYHAVPVVLPSGERFDSTKEYTRWNELQLRQSAGEIRHLFRQTSYPLGVVCAGEWRLVGRYVADFSYDERQADGSWQRVVEDTKSTATRTALFRWKAKHLCAEWGIVIRET